MTDNIEQLDNSTEQNTVINTSNNTVLNTAITRDQEVAVPEKFKVLTDDGSIDYQATLAKMNESYIGLEKRIGTGDLPPKTEEDYKIEKEGFDFEAFKADESNKTFLKQAHSKGITNSQLSFLLSEYEARAVELVSASSQLDTDTTVEALRQEWGTDYEKNIFSAVRAAQACGITQEQLSDPMIGNNVAFIKLASHFGSQMTEDTPVNVGTPVQEDIQSLMRSDAYFDKFHPDHKATVEKVSQAYAKGFSLKR